jgi:hypothetical protein
MTPRRDLRTAARAGDERTSRISDTGLMIQTPGLDKIAL